LFISCSNSSIFVTLGICLFSRKPKVALYETESHFNKILSATQVRIISKAFNQFFEASKVFAISPIFSALAVFQTASALAIRFSACHTFHSFVAMVVPAFITANIDITFQAISQMACDCSSGGSLEILFISFQIASYTLFQTQLSHSFSTKS
jgi:hypothetical protein